jgi:protein-tyrosine sulfotransferase
VRAVSQAAPLDPIFIHGVLPRSGTNFLWDLLLLHPDCARARQAVNEDLFLEHSDHLVAFADAVREAWNPEWGPAAADLPARLQAGLGEGLVSFLWTDRSKRLVTKSPSARHLDRFFDFFPSARLLILMRDGRAVAESATKTFGWDLDRACREWSEGAHTIRRFQRREAARADRWRLVRYEDLVDDPEGQLRTIFDFLGLDPSRYDFDAARHLPVRGSSAFGLAAGNVHWTAVAKDPSFAPKDRWRAWSATRLERFDWLAGSALVDFGYVPSRLRFGALASCRHTLLDWRWRTITAVRRLLYRTRVRLALRTRLAAALKGSAHTPR